MNMVRFRNNARDRVQRTYLRIYMNNKHTDSQIQAVDRSTPFWLDELGIIKYRSLLPQHLSFIRPIPNRNALCVCLLTGAVTSPSTNEEKFKYAFSNNCPFCDGIVDGAVAASDGGGDSCSCLAMWARQVDSGVANSCAPTLCTRDDQWSASPPHTLTFMLVLSDVVCF